MLALGVDMGFAGRVSRQARRHHQVDPGLPSDRRLRRWAGDRVGCPILVPMAGMAAIAGVAAIGMAAIAGVVSTARCHRPGGPDSGHERCGVRRLPQPLAAGPFCYDVRAVVDEIGHGPPGTGQPAASLAGRLRGPTLHAVLTGSSIQAQQSVNAPDAQVGGPFEVSRPVSLLTPGTSTACHR